MAVEDAEVMLTSSLVHTGITAKTQNNQPE